LYRFFFFLTGVALSMDRSGRCGGSYSRSFRTGRHAHHAVGDLVGLDLSGVTRL
jgi:hypothetical protein